MLNLANQDIAVKSHGKGLYVYNYAGNSVSAETGLEGISFLPSSSRIQAVAVRHSAREILLLSTARGTFVLPATMKVTDVSFGYMDEEGRWVRETDGEVVNRKVT